MATIVPGRAVTYDVEMPSQPSSRLCVECHVAQGSISGSMFIMYTAHLISVIKSRGLSPHITPMPTTRRSCCPAAVDALSSKISECVGAVASWMESNRLSLNCDSDKTEVVWCATSRQLSCSLSVDGTLVMPVRSAHDLGIHKDADRYPANSFAVFRRPQPAPAAPDPSLSADRHVPDTGGQLCAN